MIISNQSAIPQRLIGWTLLLTAADCLNNYLFNHRRPQLNDIFQFERRMSDINGANWPKGLIENKIRLTGCSKGSLPQRLGHLVSPKRSMRQVWTTGLPEIGN